jgi:anti-anti-sigma factor
LLFDMTGVDYMDSAGIGMLALATGKLKESGGGLAIRRARGQGSAVVDLTQLTAIVKVCPTLAAAAAALSAL